MSEKSGTGYNFSYIKFYFINMLNYFIIFNVRQNTNTLAKICIDTKNNKNHHNIYGYAMNRFNNTDNSDHTKNHVNVPLKSNSLVGLIRMVACQEGHKC